METDLKDFCEEQMKVMDHYQPWLILALIAHGGRAELSFLAEEYNGYEQMASRPSKTLRPKQRLRYALQNVLQKHGIARLDENDIVHLEAVYSRENKAAIEQVCHAAIRHLGLPAPTFVSGGLPSLGKRR